MPTFIREQGLKVSIYVDDHEPAHVHVRGDGEVKIVLGQDGEAPRVAYIRYMTFRDVARALAIVSRDNASLLAEWKKIHD